MHTYKDKKYESHLILEYLAGGDLAEYLKANKNNLNIYDKAKEFGYQIISALQFLFVHKIIHRDLKP